MAVPSLATQRKLMRLTVAALLLGAVLLVTVATRLPLAVRLLLASIDVIAAASLWLLFRQKFGGR